MGQQIMSTMKAEEDPLAENKREIQLEAHNLVEDEGAMLEDPEFDAHMIALKTEELNILGKEKLMQDTRRDIFKRLPEEYQRKLRARREAAEKGVRIELDDQLRQELQTCIKRLALEVRNKKSEEVKQINANIERLEDEKRSWVNNGIVEAQRKTMSEDYERFKTITETKIVPVQRESSCCTTF